MTDLIDRLEALGRAPAPDLDEARLRNIEARVVAATRQGPAGRGRRTLALAVAAAVVLLVAGVVFASGGAGTARLELADGVVLQRPDAEPAVGAAGDELPDGTIVVVAAGGSAVVGGDRFGPGRYLVVDGVLVAAPARSTTTTVGARSATGPPATERPVTARTTVAPSVSPTTSAATPVTPPVDADRDPVTTPARGRGDTTTTVPHRDRPVTSRPADRSATSAPTTAPSDRGVTSTRPATTRPTTTRPERTTTSMAARPTTTSAEPTTTVPRRDGRDSRDGA